MKTFEKFGGTIIVDEEDSYLVEQFYSTIPFTPTGKPFAVRLRIGGKDLYLHRVLLSAEKGQIVDHINNNPLDNRKENLRFVTASQNQMNSVAKKNKLPKGVSFAKDRNKYVAQISWQGNKIRLGQFDTVKEAENAYLKAAKFYFDNYAHHVSQQNSHSFN